MGNIQASNTQPNLEELNRSISETEGKYLTFHLENQLYGVPIEDVVQIVGIQQITEIPEFPHYAKGIINLRGSIIPLIDVRLRLGKQERAYDERTCIIVTQIDDTDIGLIVDAVEAVTDIESANVAPPPHLAGDYAAAYLTGVAKLEGIIVLLMDTAKILSSEDFSGIINQI